MLKTRKKTVLAGAAALALILSPIWLPVALTVLFIRGFVGLMEAIFELGEEAAYYLDLARRYRRWQKIRKHTTDPKDRTP